MINYFIIFTWLWNLNVIVKSKCHVIKLVVVMTFFTSGKAMRTYLAMHYWTTALQLLRPKRFRRGLLHSGKTFARICPKIIIQATLITSLRGFHNNQIWQKICQTNEFWKNKSTKKSCLKWDVNLQQQPSLICSLMPNQCGYPDMCWMGIFKLSFSDNFHKCVVFQNGVEPKQVFFDRANRGDIQIILNPGVRKDTSMTFLY